MADGPDKFERLLKAHLEVNPKSWEALQQRGIDADTPLQLDFEFTAPGEDEVRSLLRFLRAETDYEFQGGARDQADGTQRWMVLGMTSPMSLSLEVLDEWVTRMTAYGRDHGPAEFDGWGARAEESPAAARKRKRAGLRSLLRKGR
jgi:hypothetical protein